MNLRYSYSYSYSLMMTPASSSTVAVFHRRVGRYRLPITRYLARRAVRRRTSSSAVAWRHATVSVGVPCRPCRTGHYRTSSSRRRDPRPASTRRSPRTDAVTRRREPPSDVGSDRCLHLADNRTVLPSLPKAACPVLSELF